MEAFVYLNGQIISGNRAKVSVFDLGLLRGFAVFDFLRTYRKIPFHLWDHLKRFEASAEEVGMRLTLSLEEIGAIIQKLLEKVPYPEANIKLFLTGGLTIDQYLPTEIPTFFAMAYPLIPFPKDMYEKGISLITQLYERPYPTCKSTYYMPAIVGVRLAKSRGADDVLFCNHAGEILEGGTANFFAIKGKKIITAEKGIILGITRQVVLDLLCKEGIPFEVRSILKEEIPTFEGAFITSSSKEIVPLTQIDDQMIPFHPLIKRVMEAFSAYTKEIESPFLIPS